MQLQYQLRGMAILNAYRRLGLGKKLLLYGERLLRDKKVDLIWCNAREVALQFYKTNGFSSIGEPFNIQEIGTHYLMYKRSDIKRE